MDRERRKPDSAMQQQRRIEEVTRGDKGLEATPASKLRQLRLKETKTHIQSPFVGVPTVGPSQLNLRPGKVRACVAQESQDGVVQGWVEAKRMVEDMVDSITVAARDAMRNRQAREVSYPQASRRSETGEDEDMFIEVSPESAGKP